MNGSHPSLSVIVPSFNAASFLESVIDAILAQSWQPAEVIIIDDGSSDESADIAESIKGRSKLVTLLRNERNRGVLFTARRGLEAVQGDYVYFASTSDRVLPGLFEKSMNLLAAYPEAALCCADFLAFYSAGPRLPYRLGWAEDSRYLSPRELALALRLRGGYIPGASTIIRKVALSEVGCFIDTLRGHCDWFAALVAGFRRGICYVPEPLAAFRMSEAGSVSQPHRRWTVQREVFDALFDLLDSKRYEDVAPFFMDSGALACFPHVIPALLSDRRRWRFLSPHLVRRALWLSLRRAAINIAPMSAKKAAASLLNRGRDLAGSTPLNIQ